MIRKVLLRPIRLLLPVGSATSQITTTEQADKSSVGAASGTTTGFCYRVSATFDIVSDTSLFSGL